MTNTGLADAPWKQGDQVMFKNRSQVTAGGMTVEEVDTNMFDSRVKVQGKWWAAGCLKSAAVRRTGSSPVPGTRKPKQ